jgi:hypothetical protein
VTLCSQLSRDLEEDMAGTAPAERGVLVLEQPGPWGRDALKESPCPPDQATAIAAAAEAAGLRVQVVRRSTSRYSAEPRHAWLACVTPGRRFLEALTLEHTDELLTLDLQGVAEGRPTGAGELEDEPLYLACTHSTRDSCCARFGLPLARELTRAAPRGRVWHSSHLGGHRFAATMAVLPHGLWLGRLPADAAATVVEAISAGRIPLDHLRGRAGQSPAAQVAEIAARRETAIDGIDAIAVEEAGDGAVHITGAVTRTVTVRREPTGRIRPLSCGPDAKQEDPGRWVVTDS